MKKIKIFLDNEKIWGNTLSVLMEEIFACIILGVILLFKNENVAVCRWCGIVLIAICILFNKNHKNKRIVQIKNAYWKMIDISSRFILVIVAFLLIIAILFEKSELMLLIFSIVSNCISICQILKIRFQSLSDMSITAITGVIGIYFLLGPSSWSWFCTVPIGLFIFSATLYQYYRFICENDDEKIRIEMADTLKQSSNFTEEEIAKALNIDIKCLKK